MNLSHAQCSDDLECVRSLTELVFSASQARGTVAVTLLSHRAAVLAIAAALQRPASEIAEVYCAELNHLCRRASYYNEVDKGGHFAAWEQPELFSSELRAAFRQMR